jgi:flagellar hook-associated protein 1 FlgK
MTSQALRAFQRGLEVTGHNISNVNTPGYTRQRVDFAALPPLNYYQLGWQNLGQGVGITGISRIRDQWLDSSSFANQGNSGKFNALSTGLKRIDGILAEPSDRGLLNSLDQFFNSWSGLAANPGDAGARTAVRNSGQALADRIRGMDSALRSEVGRTETELQTTVGRINEIAESIAHLNQEIRRSVTSGGSPNDLLDQRDGLVNELSQFVNVEKRVFPDGAYAVYAANFTLVDSVGARQFPSNFDAATGTVSDGTITYHVRGGSLAGLLARSNVLGEQQAQLDTLANNLRSEINTLHRSGFNKLGATGVDFFNGGITPPFGGAIDFDLSAAVKANPDAISAGTSNRPGDGGLAQTLSDFRNSNLAGLGGKSFGAYWRDNVNRVATEASQAANSLSTEEAISAQISEQRQAVSGVSLDDEMANMMRFQRSYQAAAKALSIFDQTTEDLLGMLRR